jgi:hypothetical protein
MENVNDIAMPSTNAVAVNVNTAYPTGLPTHASAENMLLGTSLVDVWLKVKPTGLYMGSSIEPIDDSILVLIDMDDVVYHWSVKFGEPNKYYKSYDQVHATTGQSWPDILAAAAAWNFKKGQPFRSADLSMTLQHDVFGLRDTKKENPLAKKGDFLGYTLPTTGWKNWGRFLKSMMKQGMDHSEILVRIGYETQKNEDGQWSIPTFRRIEEVSESSKAA